MNDYRLGILGGEYFRLRRSTGSRCLAFRVMVGLFVFRCLTLELCGQPVESETQPPLAACRLQIIPNASPSARMDASRRRRIVAMPLADYRRDRGIDWRVPKNVDVKDPGIRCLLMCPGGPYIIDLQMFIDGKPFRMQREHVIERAEATANRKRRDDSSDHLVDSGTTTETSAPKDRTKTDNDVESGETATDKPPATSPSPSVARLVRYMSSQPDPVDRNESRWLLSQWTPGPALLELRDGFAAERATIAPVWRLLDRDQDGYLSTEEFSSAEERLISADGDGDDDVDLGELRNSTLGRRSSEKARAKSHLRTPWRLLVTLGDHTDWAALYSDISEFYASDGSLTAGECDASSELIQRIDANGNNVWETDETSRLELAMPDLTIQVRFGKGDESENGLSIQQLSSVYESTDKIVRAAGDSISVELGQCCLELSAAQPERASRIRSTDQIAIGAVMDGYPIFRLLDRDNDRRLSLRECKSIRACLDTHDDNRDGQLTSHELSLPVRIGVTLGPHVDQILRTAAPAVLPSSSRSEQLTAPPWFTTMDLNMDGDLSREEFLGTRDQFTQLDGDGDGLVSVKEASQFDSANK